MRFYKVEINLRMFEETLHLCNKYNCDSKKMLSQLLSHFKCYQSGSYIRCDR